MRILYSGLSQVEQSVPIRIGTYVVIVVFFKYILEVTTTDCSEITYTYQQVENLFCHQNERLWIGEYK